MRIYTRDTADDLLLSWHAQALWPQLVRKADRAGVIATKHAGRGVAALLPKWPADVVIAALAELLEDGRISPSAAPPGYVIRNFLPAQETPSSDAHRAREYRERRRDLANGTVTDSDAGVTNRDEIVTRHHGASRRVTPSVPSRSDPSVPNQPKREIAAGAARVRSKAKPKGCTDEELSGAAEVLSRLSERSGRNYGGSHAHVMLVVSRLRAGFTAWDMRRVIGYCALALKWEDKPEMQHYLRPETLFGPKAMEKYIYAARSWMPQDAPPDDQAERPPKTDNARPAPPRKPSDHDNVIPLRWPDETSTDLSDPAFEEPPWMTSTTTPK